MKAITLEDKIRVSKKVVFQKIGEEMVLLHMESGLYFGLNATGARLWELLTENHDLKTIADTLATEYETERSVLEQDVLKLLNQMAAKKLVEVAER